MYQTVLEKEMSITCSYAVYGCLMRMFSYAPDSKYNHIISGILQ